MACRCLRVDQLDAHVLDDEIQSIAQTSIDDVINDLPVRIGRLFERIRPELKTSLQAVLWTHRYFTGSSPGQQQMDISYENYNPKRVTAHFLLQVFSPYLANRLVELSGKMEWIRNYSKIEALFEAASLIHLLFFFRNGGHSTITESILSLRNWNNHQPTMTPLNYDNQNRELMWNAFRDVILLVYPFANIIKRKFVKNRKMAQKYGDFRSNPTELECVECEKPAVITMIGKKCYHISCYTCASINSDNDNIQCPLCPKDGQQNMVFYKDFNTVN